MATKCPKCQFDNPEDTRFCGNCATPLTGSQGPVISKTITMQQPQEFMLKGTILAGKYRIIEPIGRGGMGVVYKAEDIKLERTVALKFLPAELTEEKEARERFVREAKAAAALSHPHICTIYEIGEDNNQYFIAMECIEGQSLKEKILKGPLDQVEALDIALQVAEGLEEAHKKGIVHRDIKPGNIMVTEKGQAKVMDFGLAKVFGASLITKEAKTMGTVAYMSPEQAQGKNVDHRTDIWSLGVVLYEMLTGQLPFKGEFDQSMIHSILHHEPEPLTKAIPATPKALENVVFTALAKSPADRYQSMAELLEDLKALDEGLKPARAKVGLFRGRVLGIKKVYGYPAGACLAALIVLAGLFLFPKRGQVYDSIAVLPIINESGDPGQDYFARSLTSYMISELYKVSALTVTPREAVMLLENSTKPLKERARELNVKALVEASVLKSGNRVRMTASLIDPYRNRIIWSDTLEKDYSEILILQSEFCQAIVSSIKVAMTPEERNRLAADEEVNPEAWDLCLQGISIWQSPREEEKDWREFGLKALDNFRRAIDIEPNLALAYSYIAEINTILGGAYLVPSEVAHPEAREAALKAIELDENLAQAHSALSDIKLYLDWDFIAAEKEAKRALELEPGNLWLRLKYYGSLRIFGRFDEAVERIRPFLEDPLTRRIAIKPLGLAYQAAARYDEAISTWEKDPAPAYVYLLAQAYALKGNNEKALALLKGAEDSPGMKDSWAFLKSHACILALSGRREEALMKLERLKVVLVDKNMSPFYEIASIYAALGDKDEAFRYLQLAYENHTTSLVFLVIDPWLRSLHGDPRFEELQKKVGFPDVPKGGER